MSDTVMEKDGSRQVVGAVSEVVRLRASGWREVKAPKKAAHKPAEKQAEKPAE